MILQTELELYNAMQQQCGVANPGDLTLLEISGADRAKLVHNFCTADINSLESGRGCEAFVLNAKGKVLGLVTILCRDDTLWLVTVAGQAERLITHLDRYVIREDVQFNDRSTELALLVCSGPHAAKCLMDSGLSALPQALLDHVSTKIANVEVAVARTDWASEQEYLIACSRDQLETVRDSMIGSGATLCDPATFEVSRIMRGTPTYGTDVTDENLPQEADRNSRAISFTKGCYLGQETVARLDALGHVNKILRKVVFAGNVEIATGDDLFAASQMQGNHSEPGEQQKKAGAVTSVCLSPDKSETICLGYVKTAFAKTGTAVTCNGNDGIVQ